MNKEDRIKVYSQFMPGPYTNGYFIDRLDKLGFFDAPASTKRHGAYEGGLFDHSFTVAKYLVELTEKLGLTWGMDRSPYIVGMFHDFCKCEFYEPKEEEIGYSYKKKSSLPLVTVRGPLSCSKKSYVLRTRKSPVYGGIWAPMRPIRGYGIVTASPLGFILMSCLLIRPICTYRK